MEVNRRSRRAPKVKTEPTRQNARFVNQNHYQDNGAEKRRKVGKSSEIDLNEKRPLPTLPPEMVLRILKSVATKDLLSCRLVSQTWHKFSTELYRSRPDTNRLQMVRMLPIWLPESVMYVYTLRPGEPLRTYAVSETKGTLPQLLELLQTRGKDLSLFPCTNFHLSLPLECSWTGDAASLAMASFIKMYAPHIKFLTIESTYKNISLEEPRNKLLLDILTSAKNLERIDLFPGTLQNFFDPKALSWIWALGGPIHAVKAALFSPKLEDFDSMEFIANSGRLALENLTIHLDQIQKDSDGDNQRSVSILNKILESSSRTLKVLKLQSPVGFVQKVLKFPILEQVESLCIGNHRPNSEETNKSSRFLASLRSINVGIHFPRLSAVTVEFDLSTQEMSHWTTLFPCPVISGQKT